MTNAVQCNFKDKLTKKQCINNNSNVDLNFLNQCINNNNININLISLSFF